MAVTPPDPRMPVGRLSAASKAVLGIVRALSRRAKVMVLDEPTAALPEPDARHLFEVLRGCARSGTGVIYVSHRLNELFGLADRITVLRDGRHVRTAPTAAMTPQAWCRTCSAARSTCCISRMSPPGAEEGGGGRGGAARSRASAR